MPSPDAIAADAQRRRDAHTRNRMRFIISALAIFTVLVARHDLEDAVRSWQLWESHGRTEAYLAHLVLKKSVRTILMYLPLSLSAWEAFEWLHPHLQPPDAGIVGPTAMDQQRRRFTVLVVGVYMQGGGGAEVLTDLIVELIKYARGEGWDPQRAFWSACKILVCYSTLILSAWNIADVLYLVDFLRSYLLMFLVVVPIANQLDILSSICWAVVFVLCARRMANMLDILQT